jgi:hypothetical protein
MTKQGLLPDAKFPGKLYRIKNVWKTDKPQGIIVANQPAIKYR